MIRKPRNVILPEISAADYPALAALVEGMHPTWEAWRRERTAFEMSARRQGHRIAYVPVAAAGLGAWATAKKRTTLTVEDITTYVQTLAAA